MSSEICVSGCLKTATIILVPKQTNISSLNDYFNTIISKCFKRLVLGHVKSILPMTLDQHQYAYRANRSTEDTINTALHTAMTHLEQRGTYTCIQMMFMDYSFTFNTIVPNRLVIKLQKLGHSSRLDVGLFVS